MATTYYVNYATGNDSNNGTSAATAFKKIAKAAATVAAGDTILLDTGAVHMINSDADTIDITKDRVTLKGNGGMAVIDGQDRWPTPNQVPNPDQDAPAGILKNYTTKALVRVNADDVKVQNLEIKNSAGSAIDINTGTGPLTGGLFEDLYIHDTRWQAFGLGKTAGATARRIKATRGGMYATYSRSSGANNWPGMFAWKESSGGKIEDIELSENWGEGMAFPNSPHTTVKRVKIYECFSAHMYFNHAVDCTAEDIFIYHTGTTHLRGGKPPNGLTFNNEDTPKQRLAGWPGTRDITVRNLVVVGCGPNVFLSDQAGQNGWPTQQGLRDIYIYNATLVEGRGRTGESVAISFVNGTMTNVNIFNSVIVQTAGDWIKNGINAGDTVSMHHNAWYGLTSAVPTAVRGAGDSYGANPLLVDPVIPASIAAANIANYRLLNNSPVINKGVAVAERTADYDGGAIVGLPDLGAFEYGSTPVGDIQAAFNLTPTSGEAPLVVTGTDASTSTGGITSWLWNWGDGGTSATQNATHTYTAAGTYTVTLTVTGPDGTSSTTQTATVNAAGSSVCIQIVYQKCGEKCLRKLPPPPGAGYVLISTDSGDGIEWQRLLP